MELHPVGIQIDHVLEFAPPLLAQVHDISHILLGRDQADLGVGLFRQLNLHGVRVVQGGVDHQGLAVCLGHPVDNVGSRGNEVQIVFPLQALLDDFHVQKPQKAAAEAEAQGNGAFQLIAHGGVVEFQLFQGVPQVLVLGAVGGIDSGEYHGLNRTVAGQRLRGGMFYGGNGVAHPGVGYGFDGGGDVAHLTGAQRGLGIQAVGTHGTHFHHLVNGSGGHHSDIHAGSHHALFDAGVDNDAPVGVVLAVENQGLERRVPVAFGGGHVPDNHFQNGMDVDAVFGGNFRGVLGGDADDVLHLGLDLGRSGRGQVNFVDDRQDFQPGVNGEIGVGQGLGLHALGGVHYQHRAFAGGKRPGDLVVKVHMARGVDEV